MPSTLSKQKVLLIEMTQLCKSGSQIRRFLELFSVENVKENNSLQGLLNIERRFTIEDLKVKVNKIGKKFKDLEFVEPKFKTLEVVTAKAAKAIDQNCIRKFREMSLNEELHGVKKHGLTISENYLKEIKIRNIKNSGFV